MAFVLVGVTRGDELMRSEKNPVATSDDRATIEALKVSRETERDEWLKNNSLPEWAEYMVLNYEIMECETVG